MNSEVASFLSNPLSGAIDIDRPASMQLSATHVSVNDTTAKDSSDETLFLEIAKGSKEALSTLFQRHARAVFNVSYRILRDYSEAEDLLQELFLFLFQKARLFDASRGSAASWIIQMTYHRAIDRRKYLNIRHHYDVREVNEERQQSTQGQISIDEVAGRALLKKFREELSPEQQQILELHFFEGYTFHEIADRTGHAFGNVRNHYYRGLERLRSFVFPEKTHKK